MCVARLGALSAPSPSHTATSDPLSPAPGDFLLRATQRARDPPREPLLGRSEAAQEALLVDDLLTVFLGLEGQYLVPQEVSGAGGAPHLVYALSAPCSHYLREQVMRCVRGRARGGGGCTGRPCRRLGRRSCGRGGRAREVGGSERVRFCSIARV